MPSAQTTKQHPLAEVRAALPSLVGRVAVVTGATSGIGLETAKWLAVGGAHVVMAIRNRAKGNEAIDAVAAAHGDEVRQRLEVMDLDLASLESVRAFGKAFASKYTQLDILVNNAGVMIPPAGSKTRDGIELQWGVNVLGHFLLTALLLPALRAAPRAVVSTCASGAAKYAPKYLIDVDDIERAGSAGALYGQSKSGNLVFVVELQRRLEAAGITTVRSVASHPGWTATELQRHSMMMRALNCVFAQDVLHGTSPQLCSIGHGLEPATSASSGAKKQYWGPSGMGEMSGKAVEVTMSRDAQVRDPAMGAALWEHACKVTGATWDL